MIGKKGPSTASDAGAPIFLFRPRIVPAVADAPEQANLAARKKSPGRWGEGEESLPAKYRDCAASAYEIHKQLVWPMITPLPRPPSHDTEKRDSMTVWHRLARPCARASNRARSRPGWVEKKRITYNGRQPTQKKKREKAYDEKNQPTQINPSNKKNDWSNKKS